MLSRHWNTIVPGLSPLSKNKFNEGVCDSIYVNLKWISCSSVITSETRSKQKYSRAVIKVIGHRTAIEMHFSELWKSLQPKVAFWHLNGTRIIVYFKTSNTQLMLDALSGKASEHVLYCTLWGHFVSLISDIKRIMSVFPHGWDDFW